MNIRFTLVVTAILLTFPLPMSAQGKIKVAVTMTDSDSTGQFGSLFASAFRALGDVDIVNLSERPDFVLDGVVLCDQGCRTTSSFSVALRWYSPYDESTGNILATLIVTRTPLATFRARVDTVASILNKRLASYELSHMSWSARWGRQRYEEAARELVREIDAQCLEKKRAMSRALASSDSMSVSKYISFVSSRKWIC